MIAARDRPLSDRGPGDAARLPRDQADPATVPLDDRAPRGHQTHPAGQAPDLAAAMPEELDP